MTEDKYLEMYIFVWDFIEQLNKECPIMKFSADGSVVEIEEAELKEMVRNYVLDVYFPEEDTDAKRKD